MLLRFALCVGVAAALVFAAAQPSWAQKPADDGSALPPANLTSRLRPNPAIRSAKTRR